MNQSNVENKPLIFTLAQLNFTVGDITKNAQKILTTAKEAQTASQSDIILFPELALSGYPPEDLLLRADFLACVENALAHIQANLPENICAIVGYPEYAQGKIYNSAAVLLKNKRLAHHRKQLLPNYGVFDEKRYFDVGESPCVFVYKNYRLGLAICEELWSTRPAMLLQAANAQIILSINASPFHAYKINERMETLQKRVTETTLPILYVNHIGGQDDLIFDGSSFALDQQGKLVALAPFGEECLLTLQWDVAGCFISPQLNSANKLIPYQGTGSRDDNIEEAQIYKALCLSVKDYVKKNHFEKVLLGFSGGIDSALTLAIAVDALGSENVLPVLMPSAYTSSLSLDAAYQQLHTMGLQGKEISIEPLFSTFVSHLQVNREDITGQNLQARIRAVILMALSNETGALLLNTSNKSEIAVGYGTLYGDMCGAYGVIKDVWKTEVYRLARYRNQQSRVIPQEIMMRPPSAELAPCQLDTDHLPPYPLLDRILKCYIEERQSMAEIVKAGFEEAIVRQVIKKVLQSEYKRKQSPLGPRVSKLAFTRERRYPITSAYDAIQ